MLTIGNFDGVHRGHRALLEQLIAHARQVGLPATVLTFEPHPREFFAPDQAPARLASLREKMDQLADFGIDYICVCRFDARLATMSASDFIQRVLVRGLSVRHLIIGDDFRFGKGRTGDFALLQQAGIEQGFSVEAMPTVDFEGERVSSSAVRDALVEGNLEHAARLLGRHFCIAGKIVHGKKIGQQLGFPTANLHLKRNTLPFTGVFAVTVSGIVHENAGRPLLGASFIAFRPDSSGQTKPVLEVHLLDFDGDIYDCHVTVNFLHKLRNEAEFDNFDALKAQIAQDVLATRTYFADKQNG